MEGPAFRVFLDLRAWPRAIASNLGLKIQEDPKMDSFPPNMMNFIISGILPNGRYLFVL
jgi:hypothetical protein